MRHNYRFQCIFGVVVLFSKLQVLHRDMAHFVNAGKVKDETKIIVSGYIKICQSMFGDENPYYNISELVVHIIISYFAQIDYFETKSDSLSLDNTKTKLTKN